MLTNYSHVLGASLDAGCAELLAGLVMEGIKIAMPLVAC